MVDYKKKCKVCGKEYNSYRDKSKYCSWECYQKDVKLERRKCPQCGKTFKPSWNGQIHCNIDCYAKSEKLKNNAKNSLLIKYNGVAKWRENTETKSFTNKGQFKKGKKPWNYKRDKEFKELVKKIRRSVPYLEWKKKILARDNRKGKSLHVHHLKPFNQILVDNKITNLDDTTTCDELWDLDNGITLTKGEHMIISLMERLKSFSPFFLRAFEHLLKEKNKVKVVKYRKL